MRRFLCAIGGEGQDPATTQGLMASLPNTATFWDWMPPVDHLPPWLSEADLDVFATEFERTGFTGGINWYRNFHRNWELTPHLMGAKVTMPSFFVAGDRDPVLVMARPEGMDGWLDDHRGTVLIPGAGHWVQQEAPEATNEALLGFLGGLGIG
jgi:pimeloyl-ACP methyl ester carboxylesterase